MSSAEGSTLGTLAALLPLAAAAVHAASPEAAAVLQAAQAAARQALQQPLALRAETTRVQGGWAFVIAELRRPDGGAFGFDGTPLEGAAREGYVSRSFVALLQRRGSAWVAVDSRIGPTDIAWAGWAARHHAPAALFELP